MSEPSSSWAELIPAASMLGALVVCVGADRIATRLRVLDIPDRKRKHHARPTPLVGGIAIMAALIIWGCISFSAGFIDEAQLAIAALLCGVGAALVGFADDQSNTLPMGRILSLGVMLLAAFAIAPELIAAHLNWESYTALPIPPWLFIALAVVATIGFVNAVNMADGQNGIVLSMYIIWSICLVIVSDSLIAAIASVVMVSSAVVLIFNLRSHLFLGDCGTYGVSFVLAILTIAAHARGELCIESIVAWYFVPVADCLRLLITRPLNGTSPVLGDRNHFHHRLQQKFGHHKGLITYATIVALPALTASLAPRFALVSLTVLAAVYFSFAWSIEMPSLVAVPEPANDGNRPTDVDRHRQKTLDSTGTSEH